MAEMSEKRIGVTEFKAKCLSLINEIAEGKATRVILTKRGMPVAEITRVVSEPCDPWGAHRGAITFVEGVDLTAPLDVEWAALGDDFLD